MTVRSSGSCPGFTSQGAYIGDRLACEGGAASALVALGFGGPQPVVRELALEVALEFVGGGEGLHRELHNGQQFAGARVAGGEVHRGERAVVDTQGELVAVQDFEYVKDVLVAADEAEHLGDVHGVARPRVRQQFAELRALKRVEVPVSSSNPRGSSIWASARTRSCRAVDYWSVDTLL